MKKFLLFVLMSLIVSWAAFADGSTKKAKDIGYGSGGDFYSVEYEEIDSTAYFSIVIVTQSNSKIVMKMYSKNKKETIKELYDNPSTANELLMVFLSYYQYCELIEESDSQTVIALNLDNY